MSLTSPDGKTTIEPSDDAGRSFVRKLTTATDWKTGLVIPALAVLTALIIGGIIIMLTGYGTLLTAQQAMPRNTVTSAMGKIMPMPSPTIPLISRKRPTSSTSQMVSVRQACAAHQRPRRYRRDDMGAFRGGE